MRPGGGREKGNSFERRVAKKIVNTFSPFGITDEDCYRTPKSGGHRYAKKEDPGDLVISKKLRKLFGFSPECKHYKKINLWTLLVEKPKKSWQMFRWFKQAEDAAKGSKLRPMVVFKQNGKMPLMCAFPWKRSDGEFTRFTKTEYKGKMWLVAVFDDVLKTMAEELE